MILRILLVIILYNNIQAQNKSYYQAMKECDDKTTALNSGPDRNNVFLYPYCLMGSTIPKFEATTFDNHKINAQYFKGKITVINFWLTTCPPCIAEIPGLNIIHDKYKDKKVNFIAIGKNPEADRKTFLSAHPWNFEQVQNGLEVIDSVFKIKWGYPTTLVINDQMKIVEILHGGYHDSRAATEIQNRLTPILDRELQKL